MEIRTPSSVQADIAAHDEGDPFAPVVLATDVIRPWKSDWQPWLPSGTRGNLLPLAEALIEKSSTDLNQLFSAEQIASTPRHILYQSVAKVLLAFERSNMSKFSGPPPTFDPDYQPDPVLDPARYVASWLPAYRAHVEALKAQLPSMHPDCLLTIAIPAADQEEHNFLFDCLQSFSGQDTSRKKFELVVFGNAPGNCSEPLNESRSATVAALNRDPGLINRLMVSACYGTLDGESVQDIGIIRSLQNDAVLLRHLERLNSRDHIMVRCDADTMGVDRSYVSNYLRHFSAHPETDAFVGHSRWAPVHFVTDPLLFVSQRLDDIICAGGRILGHHREMGGPNFAIRASSYSVIGGYNRCNGDGEDLALSKALLKWRGEGNEDRAIRYAGKESRLYTSTRRAELARLAGVASIQQWGNAETRFAIQNSGVRTRATHEAPLIPQDEVLLRSAVEAVINKTIRSWSVAWPELSARARPVEMALKFYFGLEYTVSEQGEVVLSPNKPLRAHLDSLARQEIKSWEKRTGMSV